MNKKEYLRTVKIIEDELNLEDIFIKDINKEINEPGGYIYEQVRKMEREWSRERWKERLKERHKELPDWLT